MMQVEVEALGGMVMDGSLKAWIVLMSCAVRSLNFVVVIAIIREGHVPSSM